VSGRRRYGKKALSRGATGGDLPEHGLEDGLGAQALLREFDGFEADANIFPELGLDIENVPSDNIAHERILEGNETPRERRQKVRQFLLRHERVTLPACAGCRLPCKLTAPVGAEVSLICPTREPIGETS